MPRPRGWQRRNARARALGYRNYYDYRIHEYGRLPPSEPSPPGQRRAQLRGHRSPTDLERLLRSGRVELVLVNVARRDKKGRLQEVDVLVTDDRGRQTQYRLTGRTLTRSGIAGIRDAINSLPPGVVSRYALRLLEEK
jgi:hypothetical protein